MGADSREGLVIVAHPDDEILWCGGLMLAHTDWRWYIVTLTRASDGDRAPRFRRVLDFLGAGGAMGDLDDGPEQQPLPDDRVAARVLELTAGHRRANLLITHGPAGEYTRHRRHEECHRAVLRSLATGELNARELWCTAYEDAGGTRCPLARADADIRRELTEDVWRRKWELLSALYGFGPESWELRCAPRVEAFDRLRGSPAREMER